MRKFLLAGALTWSVLGLMACQVPSKSSNDKAANDSATNAVNTKDTVVAQEAKPGVAKKPVVDAKAEAQLLKESNARVASGRLVESTQHQNPKPATLKSKEQITKTIALKAGQVESNYVYRVSARGFRSNGDANLRLQAVWLSEGGWDAKDANGKLLRKVESKRVQPVRGSPGEFAMLLERPPQAVQLAIYLVNDGTVPLEVSNVTVVERHPKGAAPVKTSQAPTKVNKEG